MPLASNDDNNNSSSYDEENNRWTEYNQLIKKNRR